MHSFYTCTDTDIGYIISEDLLSVDIETKSDPSYTGLIIKHGGIPLII